MFPTEILTLNHVARFFYRKIYLVCRRLEKRVMQTRVITGPQSDRILFASFCSSVNLSCSADISDSISALLALRHTPDLRTSVTPHFLTFPHYMCRDSGKASMKTNASITLFCPVNGKERVFFAVTEYILFPPHFISA